MFSLPQLQPLQKIQNTLEMSLGHSTHSRPQQSIKYLPSGMRFPGKFECLSPCSEAHKELAVLPGLGLRWLELPIQDVGYWWDVWIYLTSLSSCSFYFIHSNLVLYLFLFLCIVFILPGIIQYNLKFGSIRFNTLNNKSMSLEIQTVPTPRKSQYLK